MRKWISRFSFTFLIVGGVLLYEAYQLQAETPRPPDWQLLVIVVGGALSIALGAQGIRMRNQDLRDK